MKNHKKSGLKINPPQHLTKNLKNINDFLIFKTKLEECESHLLYDLTAL